MAGTSVLVREVTDSITRVTDQTFFFGDGVRGLWCKPTTKKIVRFPFGNYADCSYEKNHLRHLDTRKGPMLAISPSLGIG